MQGCVRRLRLGWWRRGSYSVGIEESRIATHKAVGARHHFRFTSNPLFESPT